jgi:hypothetical protein
LSGFGKLLRKRRDGFFARFVGDLNEDEGRDDGVEGESVADVPENGIKYPDCKEEKDHGLGDLFFGDAEKGNLMPRGDSVRT